MGPFGDRGLTTRRSLIFSGLGFRGLGVYISVRTPPSQLPSIPVAPEEGSVKKTGRVM